MSPAQDRTERAAQDPQAPPTQFLTFRVGDETYACEILLVREILQFDTLTRVPSAPPAIRGVMNLRGSVVPVVDLALKFGLPPTAVTSRTCVILVEVALAGERLALGLMADSVSQVVELLPSDIQPPPPFGTRLKPEYLVGMGRDDKKFLLILDLHRVLSTEESVVASGDATLPETPGTGLEDLLSERRDPP